MTNERETLLLRLARIRGDAEGYADASLEELGLAVAEYERAQRIIQEKGGRLQALWSLNDRKDGE